MNEIVVHVHRQFASRVNRARLLRVVRRTLQVEKKSGDVTLYITTDSEIRLLNRKFHSTNAPTDVLSFPSNDRGYLGDIVISYERARMQARPRKKRGGSDASWSIADELHLLAVHGMLHLIGYNDLTPRAQERMWKRQEEILGKELL